MVSAQSCQVCVVSQIELAAQVPAGHSLFDDLAAHCDHRAKEQSDCGIIVLKLNMLRLAGHLESPICWLLPLTAQQKVDFGSCIVKVVLPHPHSVCEPAS